MTPAWGNPAGAPSIGALMAGPLMGFLAVAIFYSFFVDYYVSRLRVPGRSEPT